ncbi:PREDICTED: transcription factor LBX1 [Haliaeetus leucocephalus]|uniref:transcription factor LBX1 n=1 Tax=Haliaeetus leucocephalus TaxID=52644 RepID=UPI00053CAFC1|nr:PREDICTED: transcription factor LBX1 [Haliaeetus leucocephalus]
MTSKEEPKPSSGEERRRSPLDHLPPPANSNKPLTPFSIEDILNKPSVRRSYTLCGTAHLLSAAEKHPPAGLPLSGRALLSQTSPLCALEELASKTFKGLEVSVLQAAEGKPLAEWGDPPAAEVGTRSQRRIVPFGADPAAALPSRLGGLLPGPPSGRRVGPPRNPSCPPQTPQLPCAPKPAGPVGGRSGPAAAGRSAPGPALPRRGGELGRDPRDLLAGGTRPARHIGGHIAAVPSCRDMRKGCRAEPRAPVALAAAQPGSFQPR